MNDNKEILMKPRLTGPSFDNHGIPYTVFEDLAAIQQLIMTLAKEKRKQLLNGKKEKRPFGKGVSIELVGSIEKGSTLPTFMLCGTLVGTSLFGITDKEEINWARDRFYEYIDAINNNAPVSNVINEKHLHIIRKIGKNINHKDEFEFDQDGRIITYSVETRDKIINNLEKGTEVKDITITGAVFEINKAKESFWIKNKLYGNLKVSHGSNSFNELVTKALKYNDLYEIIIAGAGLYAIGSSEPLAINSITEIQLERLDILENAEFFLKSVELEGYYAEMKKFIFEIVHQLSLHCLDDLPAPSFFSASDSEITLDWRGNGKFITIDIEMNTYSSYFHLSNLNSADFEEQNITLKIPTDWSILLAQVNSHLKHDDANVR